MNQKNHQKSVKGHPQKSGGKTHKPEPMQKRVWVTDDVTRKLTKEFTTSGTTVLNALKFSSYSEQAKQIREKAMELMKENTANNEKLMQLFHQ